MKFPRNEREEAEGQVMKIYKESSPALETLFEWSYINHVAWSLVIVFLGVIFWMGIALVNAENQRNALINKQCRDPIFKTELDKKCLRSVASRDHWWQHLSYAMSNLSPEK